jgi:uncharacterized damage-inducible protein DinB
MHEVFAADYAAFEHAKSRLLHALDTTPDDRLSWQPSASARSILQTAAHVALALKNMHNMLMGIEYPLGSNEEAERHFRTEELKYPTKQAVLALLEANSGDFRDWLEAQSPEVMDSIITLPFGMGQINVRGMLPFMAKHIEYHTAQISYIQTVYGDLDWHM